MSAIDSPQERLNYETRTRRLYAVVAAAAGVLLIAWVLLTATGVHPKVDEATLRLIVEDKRGGRDIVGAILEAFDAFAIAGTLIYLLAAARARNPNVPGWIRPLTLIGGVLPVATVVFTVIYVQKAHQFVTSGDQSYQEAQRLAGISSIAIFQILGFMGSFVLALAIVLTSLQAMRVGLLPRFVGYLGMISGAVVILPSLPLFVVEAYWLGSIAVLLAGFWPSGQPPAWSSGKAEPWPSSQQLREQRVRAAGARGAGRRTAKPARGEGKPARGEGKPVRGAQAKPAAGGGAVATAGAPTPRSSSKRKRKKRH